ncbi:MAG: hypothetical protein JKY52_00020 [Flavobacteriales bacterium]|nr:hypothetical protein [Flavobacteriales bacterium]
MADVFVAVCEDTVDTSSPDDIFSSVKRRIMALNTGLKVETIPIVTVKAES